MQSGIRASLFQPVSPPPSSRRAIKMQAERDQRLALQIKREVPGQRGRVKRRLTSQSSRCLDAVAVAS